MIIFTSCILGVGAGLFWVGEGHYLALCACDSNKGFYNSYFWAIQMISIVVGNIIAAEVFKAKANQSILFIIFAVL